VEPKSQYWSVLPRAEDRNTEVEYYVAVVDAAGKMVSQSEPRSARVDGNCDTKLSPKEQGVAENMIVGETTPNQYRKKVIGFQCPGLKIRIDHQGIRRADEECGPCGLAWLPPTALATAGIIVPFQAVASTLDTGPGLVYRFRGFSGRPRPAGPASVHSRLPRNLK
jgi:hypothetical protein